MMFVVVLLQELYGCARHPYAGVVLLNPVDGEDPWGIIKSYCIHPPALVNYTTPTVILGAGLGAAHHVLEPACAPNGLNFPRFQNAMRCPLLTYNATLWGHADFLDPLWRKIANVMCVGTRQPNPPLADYRAFAAGLVTGLVEAVVQGK